MDRHIERYSFSDDGDLRLCFEDGVAYQTDMQITASYDADYFDKYLSYRGSKIASDLNKGRKAFVDKYAGKEACALDVGIGCGDFVRTRQMTRGYDINPKAVEWLKAKGLYCDQFEQFKAFTFWDVLEHVPSPQDYLDRVSKGKYLFTSVPIFHDLLSIRESKHYRPGEHLYYFTDAGLVNWLWEYGFRLLGKSDFETVAGREGIMSYAFIKD